MENDDDFLDNIEESDESEETTEQEIDLESREQAYKRELEQAQRNLLARKRIDDLLDKKRLKELLDDSDDW
ncbi:MAG: hypothetical protein QNK36_07155 [Colwellia sp.]|nr:hypothetical protein [Colwellia sp.]